MIDGDFYVTPTGNRLRIKSMGQAPAKTPAHPPVPASKPRRNKYGNKHVIVGSERFDSMREAKRHQALKQMEREGKITFLHRQRSFDLIVNGKKICRYVGDWAYVENHKAVVEDCKGYQTRDFKLKWKLCKALHPEIEWRLS